LEQTFTEIESEGSFEDNNLHERSAFLQMNFSDEAANGKDHTRGNPEQVSVCCEAHLPARQKADVTSTRIAASR
jgi:hypothetical protein